MDTRDAHDRVSRRALRDAERWLVRLIDHGDDGQDGAAFRQWLAASPEHLTAYRETERLWALSRDAAVHPDILALADRKPTDALSRVRMPLVWRFAVAALLVVAMAAGTVGWYWLSAHTGESVYATAIGQQSRVVLKDGSVLTLDTDSAVAIRYDRDAWRVDLERGRVEFAVQHDPDRRFVVRAGSGRITDVGTTFQVGINKRGAVNIVLIQGKVSIRTPKGRATLSPGQALQFNRSGVVMAARAADLSYALGWVRGELVVHDWSLPRVLAAMNRYSRVQIVIADPSLQDVRVTGNFPLGNQDLLIKVLETGWSIRGVAASSRRILLYRD